MSAGSCLPEHLLRIALELIRDAHVAAFIVAAESEFQSFSRRLRRVHGEGQSLRTVCQHDEISYQPAPTRRGSGSVPPGSMRVPTPLLDAARLRDIKTKGIHPGRVTPRDTVGYSVQRGCCRTPHIIPPSYTSGERKTITTTSLSDNGTSNMTSRNGNSSSPGGNGNDGKYALRSHRDMQSLSPISSMRVYTAIYPAGRGGSVRVVRSGRSARILSRPASAPSSASERNFAASLTPRHPRRKSVSPHSIHKSADFMQPSWRSNRLVPSALDRDPLHASESITPLRGVHHHPRGSGDEGFSHSSSWNGNLHEVESHSGLTSHNTERGSLGCSVATLPQRSMNSTSPSPHRPLPKDVGAHRSTLTGVFDWPLKANSISRYHQPLKSSRVPAASNADPQAQQMEEVNMDGKLSPRSYVSSHITCEINSVMECICEKRCLFAPGGSDNCRMHRGDIILECEGRPLASIAMLQSCVHRALKRDAKYVTLLVMRGSECVVVRETLVH